MIPASASTDVRSAGDVGRRARLELRFAERHGRTVVGHSYAEPPLRAGAPFPTDDGLHLIVASSAPGVFGGDCFEHAIDVDRGARVRLTSQSALQLHPAADGSLATLSSTYRVGPGASLECEWDPVIPFPQARLDQRIRIELAEDATLFWSDAVMSGREARHERWAFESLSHELRLVRGGRLEYLERYALKPRERAIDVPWLAEAACYFGTILVVRADVDQSGAEAVYNQIQALEGVRGAVDLVSDGVLLVRLMARSGIAFHSARALAAARLGARCAIRN